MTQAAAPLETLGAKLEESLEQQRRCTICGYQLRFAAPIGFLDVCGQKCRNKARHLRDAAQRHARREERERQESQQAAQRWKWTLL